MIKLRGETIFGLLADTKLGTKIGLGYAAIALVLAATVGVTLRQVDRTATVTSRVVDLRTPTARSSLMMLNGMNHSLAALRGWIILGADKFKAERAQAWEEEIDASFARMKGLADNWTNPENIKRLDAIEASLAEFKKYQQEIEDIAGTVDNMPATKILSEEAEPLVAALVSYITNMIDLEAELAATPERKALLVMMADVRSTTGLAQADIRAYLLSGDEEFKKNFEGLWSKNTLRFGNLTANAALLTPEQRESFDASTVARAEFESLPPRMFEIRGSDEWNLANHWLATKAAPRATIIRENLDAMVRNQQELMVTDMDEAKRLTSVLYTTEWLLLFTGSFLSVLIGWFVTRAIVGPIQQGVAFSKVVADGDFTQRLDLDQKDEVGDLARALNAMAANLKESTTSIENLRREIKDRERAEKVLASTNMELEAFSYSVSHDLRSPLRTIDGFSHAILEDCEDQLDENGINHLNRITAAARRMGGLIDDMLDLSRITRRDMTSKVFDVSEVALQIVTELRDGQPERAVHTAIQPGMLVEADPYLMRALLDNLLGNAWKFTEKTDEAKIEFGANQEKEVTTYYVRDNGAGFDMQYADKLFGAFQRLHHVDEFEGTGIGLATAQRIVNRHGGRIWAEAEVGHGATFYFTLP